MANTSSRRGASKTKTSAQTLDSLGLTAQITELRESERRGRFSPFGSILYIETERGRIQFPIRPNFEPLQLAHLITDQGTVDRAKFILPGRWFGLPDLQTVTANQCPECLRDCDLCEGSGKQICTGMGCGGRGWIDGPFQPCPGKRCNAETGKFNPKCKLCGGSGQIAQQLTCTICHGQKTMVCQRCRGRLKYSTGFKNGALYSLTERNEKCKSCLGSARESFIAAQLEESFACADYALPNAKVLGPVETLSVLVHDPDPDPVQTVAFDGVLILTGAITKAYLVKPSAADHR